MATRAPGCVDGALAQLRGAPVGAASIAGVVAWGKTVDLDVAAGEAESQKRGFGMDALSENVGG